MKVVVGLLAAGAVFAATILAVATFEAARLTNPPDYEHPRASNFEYRTTPRSQFGLPFEDVTVPSKGALLRGWYVPPGGESRRAVITVHGRSGDRTAFLPLLPALHRAGVAVLSIDLRENGTSDGNGRGTGLGEREAVDVQSAAAFLKGKGYETVAAVGCSLGASAAILAAGRDPAIDAVAADSPLSSMQQYVTDSLRRKLGAVGGFLPIDLWGELVVAIAQFRKGLPAVERPIDQIPRIAPRPLLLIHGTADRVVPMSHSEDLFARAGEGRARLFVTGADHCGAFQTDPDRYAGAVLDLFRPRVP